MRITIDHDACTGHGRCYTLAAELFDADDEGHSVLLIAGALPEHLRQLAVSAAGNCPERAITIHD
jgi:ferredoxin